ncbi:hypothetical protein [Microvirga roseola]|uniref:hypothetical protein n=1 Tax=Microvirga roseola TaxID=2883126 RepID=UPI0038994DE7
MARRLGRCGERQAELICKRPVEVVFPDKARPQQVFVGRDAGDLGEKGRILQKLGGDPMPRQKADLDRQRS